MQYFGSRLKSKISSLLCQFLRIDWVRYLIGTLRLKYFTLTRGVKFLESDDAFELTISLDQKC